MRYILLSLFLLTTSAFGSEGVKIDGEVVATYGGSSPVPGVSGVGSVANSLFSMSQQKYPVPDFSHLEREIQTARDETQKLVEQLKVAQSTLAFYTSDESKQRSRELALELARTQRLVDTPPAERLVRVANALIQKRSLEVQRKLEGPLRDYESKELRDEIRDWKLFSKDKKQVLDTINDFSAEASRLQDASSVESIYVTLSNAALQSSLDSLTEAAQIAGGHREGSFTEAFEISRSTYEIGKAILDIGLGITPGVGFAKDCYESLLGRSLIDNSPLDLTSRASAVLGVATLGGSNIIKSSFKGLIKLGQSLRKSGVLGRGFNKAVHVVDSASKHGIKIVTGPSATKVDKVILETLEGRGNVTSKIKLTADEALDAGKKWVGEGYRERKAGSGVFISVDGQRQFRMDNNSLLGNHAPDVPHVHLETLTSGQKVPVANNHIPFQD